MSDRDMILRSDVRAKMTGSYLSHQALNAIPAVQVGVKPLEWQALDNGTCWSKPTLSGIIYHATQEGWCLRNGALTHADGIEAAKSAAQANYEARIRSALTVQPAPVPELRDRMEELLHAVMWAYDRITVERITINELAATAHELENVLLHKPSHAATYDPPNFMTSPARKVLSRAALTKLDSK